MTKWRVTLSVVLDGEYVVEAATAEEAEAQIDALISSGDYDDSDSTHWTSRGAEIDGVSLVAPRNTEREEAAR